MKKLLKSETILNVLIVVVICSSLQLSAQDKQIIVTRKADTINQIENIQYNHPDFYGVDEFLSDEHKLTRASVR